MAKDTVDEWTAAMKAKGHAPVIDSTGYLDFFVYEVGHHNGPGCSSCGWSCCWHCDGIDDIPACDKPTLELTATPIAGTIQ